MGIDLVDNKDIKNSRYVQYKDMPYSFEKYEKDYNKWKEERSPRFPGVKDDTRRFLANVLDLNRKDPLWKNQEEAILRAIYCYEILQDKDRIKDILLNIVTGGGKTLIIACTIVWLIMVYDIRKFIIITPNTIVRDRIKDDFLRDKNGDTIFTKRQLFPKDIEYKYINDLGACVLEPGSSPTSMLESGIIICNREQLYHKKSLGKNYEYIMRNIERLCIINDEAHNTCAPEYAEVLSDFSEKCVFRLDTTATPTRADGQYPTTKMIYIYGIGDALKDKIIKEIIVYKPNVKLEEMIYINYETGEKKLITELDEEFIKAEKGIKPFQWILDDVPMRKQISFALDRLKRHDLIAQDRYNPLLFVITMTIEEGKRVREILINEFKVPTILVTEESSEKDKDIARRLGTDKNQKDYKTVVSVMLLREGWDVPQVSTILLLRKFSSPVYGQQVIGRGLRRIIRDEEYENLSVIDHPILEHDWLWKKFFPSARRSEDPEIDDQKENEDFRHKKIRDELKNKINERNRMTKINIILDDDFLNLVYERMDLDKLKQNLSKNYIERNWRQILDSVEYNKDTSTTIKKLTYKDIKEIYIRNDRKKGILDDIMNSPIDIPEQKEVSEDELREILKREIYELTFNLAADLGYTGMTSFLYDIMMEHISKKIFRGKGIYDADIIDIHFAFDRLKSDILNNFNKPILFGILTDSNIQTNFKLEEV